MFVATRIPEARVHSTVDVVDPGVIKACTATCPRTDCALYVRKVGSTMMGRQAFYDRDGILRVSDPNYLTCETRCGTCGHEWEVKRDRHLKEVG